MTHVFASNAASNTEPASNNASNRKVREVRHENASARPEVVVSVPPVLAGTIQAETGEVVHPKGGDGSAAPKQRWSRAAYNAYQRDYMRTRRAK